MKISQLKLNVTLDRLEDSWAVMTVSGGGEMTLPRKLFPGALREGQSFAVLFKENKRLEKSLRARVQTLQKRLLSRKNDS